jgi:hypothetical protein
MRITPLILVGVLALATASCNNGKPAEPAATATTPAAAAPSNDVMAPPPAPEPAGANEVDSTAATNSVTNNTSDDPRGLPDRREAPPTEGSEPK